MKAKTVADLRTAYRSQGKVKGTGLVYFNSNCNMAIPTETKINGLTASKYYRTHGEKCKSQRKGNRKCRIDTTCNALC